MTHRYTMIICLAFLAAGCNLPALATAYPPVPLLTPIGTPIDTAAPSLETLSVELSPSATWTQPFIPLYTPGTPHPESSGWQAVVEIADGRCCIGGVVGASVDLPIKFQAQGPSGLANAMRYQTGSFCRSAADLSQVPWQPFEQSVSIPLTISAINWVGLWVSVQFRDTQGNMSDVVCDDISVEGMPARPEASP